MSKKLVFLTNILSHYQLSLSREFIKILGDDYCFIATECFHDDMLKYGVPDLNQKDFVLRAYDSKEAYAEAMALAEDAECLIFCGIPAYVDMSLRRSQKGKITFEYSERLFKHFGLKQILWILAARFSPLRRHVLKRRLKRSAPPQVVIYTYCVQEHLRQKITGCAGTTKAARTDEDIFRRQSIMTT